MHRILTLVIALSILPACASRLPPVFNAAQLKAGANEGYTYRYRVRSGSENRVENLRFEGGGDCRFEVRVEGLPGAPEVVDCTFKELAQHGAFPKGLTSAEEGRVTVPAGTFDAFIYNVVEEDKGRISRYWFAKELAGPPVRHEVIEQGESVYLSELFSYLIGQPPPPEPKKAPQSAAAASEPSAEALALAVSCPTGTEQVDAVDLDQKLILKRCLRDGVPHGPTVIVDFAGKSLASKTYNDGAVLSCKGTAEGGYVGDFLAGCP